MRTPPKRKDQHGSIRTSSRLLSKQPARSHRPDALHRLHEMHAGMSAHRRSGSSKCAWKDARRSKKCRKMRWLQPLRNRMPDQRDRPLSDVKARPSLTRRIRANAKGRVSRISANPPTTIAAISYPAPDPQSEKRTSPLGSLSGQGSAIQSKEAIRSGSRPHGERLSAPRIQQYEKRKTVPRFLRDRSGRA